MDVSEPLRRTGETTGGTLYFSLKRWLRRDRDIQDLEEASEWNSLERNESARNLTCVKQRLLLVAFILLALAAMVLLLLWNYHCIMVWHLCREYPSFPMF